MCIWFTLIFRKGCDVYNLSKHRTQERRERRETMEAGKNARQTLDRTVFNAYLWAFTYMLDGLDAVNGPGLKTATNTHMIRYVMCISNANDNANVFI